MFGDFNKVILLGNVTREPELRFTPSGAGVLNFGLATNRRYKSGEEWKDEVTYHNIVVWRNAESLSKRVKKGTRLMLEGRVSTRSWDDSAGKKQYKTEIIVDSVNLISRYEGEKSGNTPLDESGDGIAAQSGGTETIEPDDLPF
jgi:single-strand DNA-binding protein